MIGERMPFADNKGEGVYILVDTNSQFAPEVFQVPRVGRYVFQFWVEQHIFRAFAVEFQAA